MKNQEQRNIENRLNQLERDSHPPVNWKEIIQSNIGRIEELEDVKDQLMDIIKSMTMEKKELKERIEIMEKIIEELLPRGIK